MLNKVVRRILRMQLGIAIGGAVLWGVLEGARAALAAAAGGGISATLTFYVAARVFNPALGDSPERVFGALVRAEIMKLLLTAVLISIAVIGFPDQAIPLTTTLAATLLAYWLSLLRADY